MFIVKTPCGKEIIFDSEDICPKRKMNLNSVGYARYTQLICHHPQRKYKTILVHRLIAKAKSGEIVDHINGNKLDNRLNNLRITSHRNNVANSLKRFGKSKYLGVSYVGNNVTSGFKEYWTED